MHSAKNLDFFGVNSLIKQLSVPRGGSSGWTSVCEGEVLIAGPKIWPKGFRRMSTWKMFVQRFMASLSPLIQDFVKPQVNKVINSLQNTNLKFKDQGSTRVLAAKDSDLIVRCDNFYNPLLGKRGLATPRRILPQVFSSPTKDLG